MLENSSANAAYRAAPGQAPLSTGLLASEYPHRGDGRHPVVAQGLALRYSLTGIDEKALRHWCCVSSEPRKRYPLRIEL